MTPAPGSDPRVDTIVAVSSPPGRSHRGIVRLTGDDTQRILDTLLDEPASQAPPGRLAKVKLASPAMPLLLTRFAAPKSYTGQDLAELQVPGNPALLERLLHLATQAGARLAEPGEFTFRAYLAGKLDLTQAEGVAATIHAVSDGQLKAARLLLDGKLGRFARELVDDLGTRLALVEAGIDFTDQEDVIPIAPGELDEHLARIEARLDDLLAHSRPWGEVQALPWVVLVGAPSAGKSTLFNALLNRNRAVIDPMPGTTRDVLCEPMTIQTKDGTPSEVMLVDLAGLDEPTCPLDFLVQAAVERAIDRADLILRVVAPDEAASSVPKSNALILTVFTQSDLREGAHTEDHPSDAVHVSAVTGDHLDTLRSLIADRLGDSAVSVSAQMLALQPRHEQALNDAKSQITLARQLLADQLDTKAIQDVELIAGHLREALNSLAALGGELSPDDVIGKVFATFCVGK